VSTSLHQHNKNLAATERLAALSPISLQPRREQINLGLTGFHRGQPKEPFFSNPIIPAPSADPWLVRHEGIYYYCESRGQTKLYIRKAAALQDIANDEGRLIWTAPQAGPNSNAVWAPEMHFLQGKWYIYYAADDGLNENHRMWVLESETSDPMGPYHCRGAIVSDDWAIDGTVLTLPDGNLYFAWSGWPGKVNGQQNIYIARMKDPCTLAGPRTLLVAPTESWEKVEMAICEGPQFLQRHGKLFMIYSASGSWTVDYCLGMMVFKGGDVLDPKAWDKVGPVFKKTKTVWGVGHCSFVQSPDGVEDWLIFHAKSKTKKGWNDRNVHAQRFTWTQKGYPHFGTPITNGIPVQIPSGTNVRINADLLSQA
jgi:GH43 family beta-xylosidase